MAKFNVVQKRRRTQIAEKKRKAHGDPSTGKLKVKSQPLSISGKRKRKLLKQWRRDQKDALQQGLITMEDVQMALSPSQQGETKDTRTSSAKIHLKKKKKLKTSFKIKAKGKNKRKSDVPAADISTDAMVE
ncbi:hypothetical protein TanjilG_04109 [Lupinus angustifolius]|uniref:Uncharacterized protein n=1 Tax=Lupinus angustifolius TaxID=3871 RepID=A0A1J7H1C2_LUPAN|nr:PREDICTED: uncharacterized protein LOC109331218 isoform X1 [Lupinus angustifolius]XP_019442505.1 PREDICTED: uncharacterized protein LOC109347250 isoform X1 [Lupinus angustifolius]OIV94178.1 hypothetical protein TanjilG_13795 [Lupinus angustifolius]OIW12360.1 hypothetical protein TanjilG_04109 [Lupinus angustifolius]